MNEFTLNATLEYEDSEETSLSLQCPTDLVKSITNKRYSRNKVSVGITEEAIPLGEVSAPGWAMLINRDTTNFVDVRVGTGGAKFARLLPSGGFCFLRFGPGATAPYWIADTLACQCEYLIFDQ